MWLNKRIVRRKTRFSARTVRRSPAEGCGSTGECADADYAGVVSFAVRIAVVLIGSVVASVLTACGLIGQHHPDHPTRTNEPVVTGEPAGFNADDVAFASKVMASTISGSLASSAQPPLPRIVLAA